MPLRLQVMTRNTTSKIEPGSFPIPRDGRYHRPRRRPTVALTNLHKVFFPATGATKGDLLQYYADVAPFLIPYMQDRAQVMKRYPNGQTGEFFYMKRTPPNAPPWLRTCSIEHGSGSVIAFPMIDDLAGLLWLVNLGCIDLNEWYSRCDDTDRPDYLHFDLDPVKGGGTSFATVRKVALYVHEALVDLGITPYAKTSGSAGIHVYVPIERGPLQKEVWTFAKAFAQTMERMHPDVITAEYRIAKRPTGRVLVDYNQNAWGKTLASVYSVRAKPRATVSTPVTLEEIEAGIEIEDFRLDNVRERFVQVGDLWAPMKRRRGRLKLERFIPKPPPKRPAIVVRLTCTSSSSTAICRGKVRATTRRPNARSRSWRTCRRTRTSSTSAADPARRRSSRARERRNGHRCRPPSALSRRATARAAGLADAIHPSTRRWTACRPRSSFDVIWSEGAIYIMGFERGLRAWRPLVRTGGYVVVSRTDVAYG